MDDVKKMREKSYSIEKGFSTLRGDGLWKTNKISRTAIAKYNRILLENDEKKLQYFIKLSEKGINKEVSLKEILDAPTPVEKEKVENKRYKSVQKHKLYNYTEKMIENLKKTESIFHKNSKEYEAMKTALRDLHLASDDDIGSKIEALQKSAMEYAQAKGVGEQYSKRGQARMYAALDMCDEMSEYMGIFASKERMKDIQDFEKGLTEKTINKEEKNEMNKGEDELDSFEK